MSRFVSASAADADADRSDFATGCARVGAHFAPSLRAVRVDRVACQSNARAGASLRCQHHSRRRRRRAADAAAHANLSPASARTPSEQSSNRVGGTGGVGEGWLTARSPRAYAFRYTHSNIRIDIVRACVPALISTSTAAARKLAA